MQHEKCNTSDEKGQEPQDCTRVWDTKQKATNEQTELTDTDDGRVVTRGRGDGREYEGAGGRWSHAQ